MDDVFRKVKILDKSDKNVLTKCRDKDIINISKEKRKRYKSMRESIV